MLSVSYFKPGELQGPHCLCRHGSNYIESLGFASLTVWNMKTWRAMVCPCLSQILVLDCSLTLFICFLLNLNLMKSALPLGEDPPAITSLSFNHNGKILAAAATDGMIHIFGILL